MTREHPADHVDRLRAQWLREMPGLDTSPMEIIGRARRITLALRPDIEAVFARHGLDAGEFDVLGSLRRSGPPYRLRPTELYKVLMISSGGLTDRLARLEARGLVRRIPSPEVRRSLMVELTSEGRAKAEAAFAEDMALELQMVSALTDKEREELARLLRKLALSLEAAAQAAAEPA